MPTDTPDMSRAALEALAERLARYSVRESNALEDDLLQAAATLRALAAEREPPADVTVLVEEARQYAGKAMRSADTYRETRRRELAEERKEVADLVSRLAAALTAQAERADRTEDARRIAALEIAGKHLALKLAEFYRLGRVSPSECQAMREWMALMPARALAAKLKGEG